MSSEYASGGPDDNTGGVYAADASVSIAYPIAGNVGYVIGRKGATIKRIATETGAYLKVDDSNVGAEVVNISGSSKEMVDAAIARIEQVIHEAESRPKAESAFVDNIQVERFQAAKVIGRHGENIRRIQDETGAHIRVQSRGSGAVFVRVEADAKEAGEAAMSQVREAVATARPFPAYGEGGGHTGGGGGFRRGGFGGGFGGREDGVDGGFEGYDGGFDRRGGYAGGGYRGRDYGGERGGRGRFGGDGGYGDGGYAAGGRGRGFEGHHGGGYGMRGGYTGPRGGGYGGPRGGGGAYYGDAGAAYYPSIPPGAPGTYPPYGPPAGAYAPPQTGGGFYAPPHPASAPPPPAAGAPAAYYYQQ